MTEQERFQLVAKLFIEASRIPREEVEAFLNAQCGGDEELHKEVRLMLGGADKGSVFGNLAKEFESLHARVRQEIIDSQTTFHPPGESSPRPGMTREVPGDLIGRYRLIELIGEGGFGRVWLADQLEPVQRPVALKVIKVGMDTPQVVARFEQERQALAVMDHPGIAKVFDAGTTATGRAYFVMELCPGQPISTFCDTHRLSIRERLDLIGQACAAVQHAHTKGIIHRDLKPSNVLVSMQEGRAVAKIIDFGIAKAIETPFFDREFVTEHRQLIGTPEYMSPEQAGGELDIDTRTDIYSLGVLLYELLTGSAPFSSRQLRSAAQDEIYRIIRDVEPQKPSTRLSQSTDTITTVAESRRLTPARLAGVVRGELDWVVMRALEKDRSRRYESASAFAADIRRYLEGQAVHAAPPSRVYRARKFVRRYKGVVAATAVVGTVLVIGVAAFAWQSKVAGEQRDRAVAAERQTKKQAEELKKISEFQSSLLSKVDAATAGLGLSSGVRDQLDASLVKAGVPDAQRTSEKEAFAKLWARVNATDAAKELINTMILKPALEAIDADFADQPLLEAKLRSTISERYVDIGLYDEAWNVNQRVVAGLRQSVGENDPLTVVAVIEQCRLLNLRAKPKEAQAILRPLIEVLESGSGQGTPLVFLAMNHLGESLSLEGKPLEAESYFQRSLEGRRRTLGDDHQETLVSMSNVAAAMRAQGRFGEAEVLERDVLGRRRRVLGEQHPLTLSSMNSYATNLAEQGKHAEAKAMYQGAMEGRRRVLGEVHPETLKAVSSLAAALDRMGEKEEAGTMLREAWEKSQQVLGEDHPDTLNALSNLATHLIDSEKYAQAEPMCRKVLERRIELLGRKHPQTLVSLNVMSFLMQRQSKPAEALVYLRQALEVSVEVLGEDHPDRIILLINRGTLSRELGELDEAEGSLREGVERSERTLGLEHPYTQAAVINLADTLKKQNKKDELVALLLRVEPTIRKAPLGTDARTLRSYLLKIGSACWNVGRFVEGEKYLLEAYELNVKYRGATHEVTLDCVRSIVDMYTAWHLAEAGKGLDAKAAEWQGKLNAAKSTPTSEKP